MMHPLLPQMRLSEHNIASMHQKNLFHPFVMIPWIKLSWGRGRGVGVWLRASSIAEFSTPQKSAISPGDESLSPLPGKIETRTDH